jgi:hypothetical protein
MLHCGINVRTSVFRCNVNGHALTAAESFVERGAGAMVCVAVGSGESRGMNPGLDQASSSTRFSIRASSRSMPRPGRVG